MFILNNRGYLRFAKIFTEAENKIDREALIKNILTAIRNSNTSNIVFDFDYTENKKRKLIYRQFESVYIVLIVDDLENELGIYDFITLIIKCLDDIFKGVNETHIIMNVDKVYYLVD